MKIHIAIAICAGIHRSPVNSPHKGQWRGALMFSLICNWINDWVNNRETGYFRCYHAHYDVNGMKGCILSLFQSRVSFRRFLSAQIICTLYLWSVIVITVYYSAFENLSHDWYMFSTSFTTNPQGSCKLLQYFSHCITAHMSCRHILTYWPLGDFNDIFDE